MTSDLELLRHFELGRDVVKMGVLDYQKLFSLPLQSH